jgi:hypothetical protein
MAVFKWPMLCERGTWTCGEKLPIRLALAHWIRLKPMPDVKRRPVDHAMARLIPDTLDLREHLVLRLPVTVPSFRPYAQASRLGSCLARWEWDLQRTIRSPIAPAPMSRESQRDMVRRGDEVPHLRPIEVVDPVRADRKAAPSPRTPRAERIGQGIARP